MALKSFFVGCRATSWDAKHLPALSALYDGLIDDDDEVREVAAGAAAGLLGRCFAAPTAADRLVEWLSENLGSQEEFRRLVAYRMAGQAPPLLDNGELLQLAPAEEQLVQAMDFDDSLFATEEQNLFVDEIRETKRWQRAFGRFRNLGDQDQSVGHLISWTAAGLGCLIRLADKHDGALGWTSDQHVFAACARIILCAVAITGTAESSTVSYLLDEFRGVGTRAQLHGSLLEMARLEASQ